MVNARRRTVRLLKRDVAVMVDLPFVLFMGSSFFSPA
jgi:hypothetical protein